MRTRAWLVYAIITTAFWGIWGALIELPEKAGFPATLGYSVWALTMIPPCLIALKTIHWRLEKDQRSILLGLVIGLTGAGGQLVLFQALRMGPAYLVFPIISLSPVVTVILSYLLLRERASGRGWVGIALALLAIPLLSYQPPTGEAAGRGSWWLVLALLVFLAWGVQAYVMKFANETMKAESIFFYMTITGLLLIPVAVLMTDFSKPVNWGIKGPYLTALIQTLNAIGALCLVFALRYGKAIIVSPLTNAVAPVITVVLSLSLYRVIPHTAALVGMILALSAAFLLAVEQEPETAEAKEAGVAQVTSLPE